MQKPIVLIVLLLSSMYGFGHNYYFGFAEMQYNAFQKRLEATLVLSAHDFEEVLFEENKITTELAFLQQDSLTLVRVSEKILADFSVLNTGKKVQFTCLGFEMQENGLMNCYFMSEQIENPRELTITFTCLMKEFPEQQNKLTYIHANKKETLVFLATKPTAILTLESPMNHEK